MTPEGSYWAVTVLASVCAEDGASYFSSEAGRFPLAALVGTVLACGGKVIPLGMASVPGVAGESLVVNLFVMVAMQYAPMVEKFFKKETGVDGEDEKAE